MLAALFRGLRRVKFYFNTDAIKHQKFFTAQGGLIKKYYTILHFPESLRAVPCDLYCFMAVFPYGLMAFCRRLKMR